MIAVAAVIGDHLLAYPRGGFVGVDVFFVISGYLITSLLLREYGQTGRISLRGFYIRRAKRILPAAILVLGTTLAFGRMLFDESRFRDMSVDVVAAAVFGANWRFAAVGADYFQQGLRPSPVQHFWSLAVEEQFYLLWPALLLAVLTLSIRYARRNADARLTAALAAVGGLTAISFCWSVFETATGPTVAYFSTFSRAWELGVGACVALLRLRGRRWSARTSTALAWLGLATVAISIFSLRADVAFPGPWALAPVAGAALVIGAERSSSTAPKYLWPLTNRVSQYLGDISYSLYLWHFPVVIFLPTLVATEGLLYPVLSIGLVSLLAVVSYHFVEDPLRNAPWPWWSPGKMRIGRPQPALALGLGSLLLVSGVAVIQGPPQVVRPPSSPTECFGAAALDPALVCPLSQGNYVLPAPADLVDDTAGAFDCWIAEGERMKRCAYGDPSAKTRVAIVGDSHAAMLLPGLKSQLKTRGWRLDAYVGWGCQWMRTGTGSTCDGAMRDIQKALMTGKAYDVVLVTAARQRTAQDKSWVSQMYADAWRPVAERGSKIVVVADSPAVDQSALDCVLRIGFSPAKDDCSTPVSHAFSETDPLLGAARLVDGTAVVDLRSFYCKSSRCPAVIGNVIVYRDTVGHITSTFSRTLGPYLVDAVARAAGLAVSVKP
ncbi:MAG: acyltransferase [Hamadaea sp.]|nr:acyltransferase [Hamadaea sp.]